MLIPDEITEDIFENALRLADRYDFKTDYVSSDYSLLDEEELYDLMEYVRDTVEKIDIRRRYLEYEGHSSEEARELAILEHHIGREFTDKVLDEILFSEKGRTLDLCMHDKFHNTVHFLKK